MKRKFTAFVAMIAFAVLGLTACGGDPGDGNSCSKNCNASAVKAHQQAATNANDFNKQAVAPKIVNHLDYQNFFKAQQLYDDPSTVQFCTTTWGNASAPLVTVAIAGKLTSSSVSLNPTNQTKIGGGGDGGWTETYNGELVSSDGMYHGSPPPYRYGFTPGGQYVDFTNMPTFCTTSLTSFQREKTVIQTEIDPAAVAATQKAVEDLKKCNENLDPNNASKNQGTAAAACKAAQDDLAGLDTTGGK